MSDTTYLERQDVPEEWRTLFGYKGTKYRARIHEDCRLYVNDCDLDWSGGTRSLFTILLDGKRLSITRKGSWPECKEQVVPLDPAIVVEHSTFCGKDMGLIFHIGPNQINRLRLPAEISLTQMEKEVLWVHAARKSSYNGKNRHQMLQEAQRWKSLPQISLEDYKATVERLKLLGLLNKATAITLKGRNEYEKIGRILW